MLMLTLLLFLATLSALNCGGRKSAKKSQNTAASQKMTIPRSVSSETASTAKKSQARTPLTPQTPLSEDEAVRQTEKDQDYIPPKDSMTYVKSTDTLKKPSMLTCKSRARKQLKLEVTQRSSRTKRSKEQGRSKTRKTQRGKVDDIMSEGGMSDREPAREMVIGEYEQLIPADKEKVIIATYDTQASTVISEDCW